MASSTLFASLNLLDHVLHLTDQGSADGRRSVVRKLNDTRRFTAESVEELLMVVFVGCRMEMLDTVRGIIRFHPGALLQIIIVIVLVVSETRRVEQVRIHEFAIDIGLQFGPLSYGNENQMVERVVEKIGPFDVQFNQLLVLPSCSIGIADGDIDHHRSFEGRQGEREILLFILT